MAIDSSYVAIRLLKLHLLCVCQLLPGVMLDKLRDRCYVPPPYQPEGEVIDGEVAGQRE